MRLNGAQEAAIAQDRGPCLVLAGAGSGKTRVIVQKLVRLIQSRRYEPEQIAAITFTNKAAAELRQRLKYALDEERAQRCWIHTFHSLGLKILRLESPHCGLKEKLVVLDTADQRALLKQLSSERTGKLRYPHVEELMTQIAQWKMRLLRPDDLYATSLPPPQLESVELYARYSRYLTQCGLLDFEDLLQLPLQLFQARPDRLRIWRSRLTYFFIDEYQDTNYAQYQLFKAFMLEAPEFTVVGDDDQAIYGWRGAEAEIFSILASDFPTLKVVKLEHNYRCTPQILAVANRLIGQNIHIFEKKLIPLCIDGPPVQVIAMASPEQEAEQVLWHIKRHQALHEHEGMEYAVLYRSNQQGDCLEAQALLQSIPYSRSGGFSFFDRQEIRCLMNYFRVLYNPKDDYALLKVVNQPKRGLGPTNIERIARWEEQKNLSLFEKMSELAWRDEWRQGSSQHTLRQFTGYIEALRQPFLLKDAEKLMEHVLSSIEFDRALEEMSKDQNSLQLRKKNSLLLIDWIIKALRATCSISEKISFGSPQFGQILDQFALRSVEIDTRGKSGIQFLTIHAAKGLEFDCVYVVGCEEGYLPHQASILVRKVAEERRLAYVAVTRAKRELTLTFCKRRRMAGKWIEMTESRFLGEMGLVHSQKNLLDSKSEMVAKGRAHIAQLRTRYQLKKGSL